MQSVYEIIKKPIISEKSNAASEKFNEIVLVVSLDATKPLIKQAVESLFSVQVEKVRTMIVHGKTKRRGRSEVKSTNWKKAIVRLKPGQSIDFYTMGVN